MGKMPMLLRARIGIVDDAEERGTGWGDFRFQISDFRMQRDGMGEGRPGNAE